MIRVTTNAGRVSADLASMASSSLEPQFAAITRNAGRMLQSSIRSHAPRGTGRYRRSWRVDFKTFPLSGTAVATVGTDEPYGYRLEEGFMGADSAGKVMSQSPQPHVEPALAEVVPVFVGQLEAAVRVWLARQPRS